MPQDCTGTGTGTGTVHGRSAHTWAKPPSTDNSEPVM